MNADGSPVVGLRIVSSAVTVRPPWWLPTGLLAGGAILLAAAITISLRAVRRSRVNSVG